MNKMQATNRPTSTQSRCVYCGSTNRGKGCRYGPHGVHFHPDDSTKCAYCGSSNYGRGCKTNPVNDLHIHGINYNVMFRESVQNFLNNSTLMEELSLPFNKFRAYKLGIINENGDKVKSPTTIEEKQCFGPFVKTIIKLKKFLGPKIDLMRTSENFNESLNIAKFDQSRHSLLLNYQDQVKGNVDQLYRIIENAKAEGLTLEEILTLIKT